MEISGIRSLVVCSLHNFLSAEYLFFLIPFPVKNQETGQLEYLIPEKSSLRRHLQYTDKKFVDFLSYLLQINPRKRPTAIEALQHRWLSVVYCWACHSSSFLTNWDSVWSHSSFLMGRISFWSYLAHETTPFHWSRIWLRGVNPWQWNPVLQCELIVDTR